MFIVWSVAVASASLVPSAIWTSVPFLWSVFIFAIVVTRVLLEGGFDIDIILVSIASVDVWDCRVFGRGCVGRFWVWVPSTRGID